MITTVGGCGYISVNVNTTPKIKKRYDLVSCPSPGGCHSDIIDPHSSMSPMVFDLYGSFGLIGVSLDCWEGTDTSNCLWEMVISDNGNGVW
jgi:hypothetical protein